MVEIKKNLNEVHYNKTKSSALQDIVEKHKNSLNKQKISNKLVEKHINSSNEIENVIHTRHDSTTSFSSITGPRAPRPPPLINLWKN